MKSMPDISVAIPTYNREKVLVDTIRGALNQSHKNIEVLVIDQTKNHLPATKESLQKISDMRLRYFFVDPPSVTAAKNFAIKNARAPIILFLDDDVILDKDLVKYHLDTYASRPDVGAVAGRVLQEGFPIKDEVLRFDELATSHGVFTATKESFTNAFPGGNCSMRIKDALSVGGFDTRYYGNAFREENDLSMRLAKAGIKILFQPKAVLTHLAAPSGGSRTKAYKHLFDTPMFYRNELFFTLRAAKPTKRWRAVKSKYEEYCRIPSRRRAVKRKVYFILGILGAVWRTVFGRQLVSKERS